MRSVVILGGGYAGLAAAIRLVRSSRAKVTLIDRSADFCHQIQLHRSVYGPIDSLRVPYAELARRIGFDFLQAEVQVDRALLPALDTEGRLSAGAETLTFDALLLATGARTVAMRGLETPLAPETLTLETIRSHGLHERLRQLIADQPADRRWVTVIGAGATGVQFLFEIHDWFQGIGEKVRLRLVALEAMPLAAFPNGFADYALYRARKSGLDLHLETRLLATDADTITVQNNRERLVLPSALTLAFPGVAATPFPWRCNAYGQALAPGGEPCPRIFAAGDCSHYEGEGSNALTAQVAVRKALHVADNLPRLFAGEKPRAYGFQELGYFVSLGMFDGIGWIFWPGRPITGLAAFAAKEAIESQFSFLLRGVDSYFL